MHFLTFLSSLCLAEILWKNLRWFVSLSAQELQHYVMVSTYLFFLFVYSFLLFCFWCFYIYTTQTCLPVIMLENIYMHYVWELCRATCPPPLHSLQSAVGLRRNQSFLVTPPAMNCQMLRFQTWEVGICEQTLKAFKLLFLSHTQNATFMRTPEQHTCTYSLPSIYAGRFTEVSFSSNSSKFHVGKHLCYIPFFEGVIFEKEYSSVS